MSDWDDAVDPVQRREFTPAEKRRLQALMELRRLQALMELRRRRQRLTGWNASPEAVPSFVDPAFDDEA